MRRSLIVAFLWCPVLGAVDTPRIKATNTVQLNQHVGQRITVYGQIETTGKSSSGHQFLNFYGKQISVMCPSDLIAKFREGPPAEVYRGQAIQATGRLQRYKGRLQLRLASPQDIQRQAARAPPARKRVVLKEIGKNVWISPAGLKYQGRDPDGRTRVEHVLRHARDLPNRDGPHGVFEGDRGEIFAVIDEAWRLAEQRKLPARTEGQRSTYLVRMDRRVGYLGGRLGRQRGHPRLDRVFIVFETGTKNIVTAFPR